MDINDFLEPVQAIFDWLRTNHITLYGYTFTYMDLYVFQLLAVVVIWFIKKIIDSD